MKPPTQAVVPKSHSHVVTVGFVAPIDKQRLKVFYLDTFTHRMNIYRWYWFTSQLIERGGTDSDLSAGGFDHDDYLECHRHG